MGNISQWRCRASWKPLECIVGWCQLGRNLHGGLCPELVNKWLRFRRGSRGLGNEERFIGGSMRRLCCSFNAWKKKNVQGREVTCVTPFTVNMRTGLFGNRDNKCDSKPQINSSPLFPSPTHPWNDAMTSRAVMSFIKIFPDRCSGKSAAARERWFTRCCLRWQLRDRETIDFLFLSPSDRPSAGSRCRWRWWCRGLSLSGDTD